MIKVLIADKLSIEAENIFKNNEIKTDTITGLKEQELIEIADQYDGIVIRSGAQINSNIIEKATKLKVIGRAGIGVDNIDIKAATKNGVIVMNTPFGNSVTTAEHTIALIMSLARNIPQANISTHAGKWEKSKFVGVELFSKNLGMIGCGNIGSLVVERAKALKMKVIVYDPFISEENAKILGIEKVDLKTLIRRADFITLHTPLTDKTRGILNKKSLAECKPTVRIINCARGGLIVEEDLKDMINDGKVAGAAIDVFSKEPSYENVLFNTKNTILTPHLGASTNEAQENVAIQIAQQVSDYIKNGAIVNALNMSPITIEEAPKIKPYLDLAEKLGKFAGQISDTSFSSISITFLGQSSNISSSPLVSTMLAGIFSSRMSSVNNINSLMIAKSKNIEVITSYQETGSNYLTEINLSIKTENRVISISGSLFANTPRIVKVMNMRIEAELSTNMLFISNTDKPGFIGNLGTTLGNNNINIATFNLGRTKEGDAIALLEVDQHVNDDIIDLLRGLPHVKYIKRLQF